MTTIAVLSEAQNHAKILILKLWVTMFATTEEVGKLSLTPAKKLIKLIKKITMHPSV